MHEIHEESIEKSGKKYVARLIKLDNAIILFIDEDVNFRLGTLAIAMPDLGGMHYLSFPVLGGRNINLARILAERVSVLFRGLVLVSIHLSSELELTNYGIIAKLAEEVCVKASVLSR
ncbi:MAG: proteasome assembly chaperone 4 family protein [Candidatus Bathyarchaeia archaeon]